MTLRLAYELGFALACTAALLIVLLGGELPTPAWGSLAVVWIAGFLHMRGHQTPAWVGTALGLVSLLIGASMLAARGVEALIVASALAIVGLLVGRVLVRTELRHDLQALLLTLLLVFAGAGLHSSMSYGVVFIGYAIAVVWALITRQLVEGAYREAARRRGAALGTTMSRRDIVTPTFFVASALLSVFILTLTLALFVAFPRVGMGSFTMAVRGRRLPDRVSLSGPRRAGMSSEVVARVSGVSEADYRRGLYLRARSYARLSRDGFDRGGDSGPNNQEVVHRIATQGRRVRYKVFLQPVSGNRLPTLGWVETLRVISSGASKTSQQARLQQRGLDGDIVLRSELGAAIRYEVDGYLNRTTLPGSPNGADPAETTLSTAFERWLALPPDLDPAIIELAKTVAGDARSFKRRASKIRAFFLDEFDYTLTQPTAGEHDPLATFLLDARAGHCEHFATAFATMLRAVGIPARVVGGFQGGIWNDASKTVLFGLNNAHAWVEWYLPNHGWVTDDATPPFTGASLSPVAQWFEALRENWDDYVIDYGFAEQSQAARSIRRSFQGWSRSLEGVSNLGFLASLIACGVAGAVAVIVLRQFNQRRFGLPRDTLGRAIHRALEESSGRSLAHHRTFREALRDAELSPSKQRSVGRAIDYYEGRRFGCRVAEPGVEKELLAELKSAAPTKPFN